MNILMVTFRQFHAHIGILHLKELDDFGNLYRSQVKSYAIALGYALKLIRKGAFRE